MPLSTLAIKNAKPKDRPYKLADERGLYLLVTPAGGRLWRFKYRLAGKEKLLAIGAFPDVSLVEARDAREEARRQLAKGADPSSEKREAKGRAKQAAADSFEVIAREWLAKRSAQWSDSTRAAIVARLEGNVFPKIGGRAVSGLTATDVLNVIKSVESRGASELARCIHRYVSNVMRYAIVTSRAERNPAADVKGALNPFKPKHHPAITDPKAIGKMLAAFSTYWGSPYVKLALPLLAHTFVRPSELRKAMWAEIDLEARTWVVPAERMKMRRPHVVPLTDQTVGLFKQLREFKGKEDWVFPGLRSQTKPISGSALLKAMEIMGYPGEVMVAHGFRSTASTRLHEAGFAIDVIEAQLAHAQRGVRGVYNRALYLKERREMLEWWSRYLDDLRAEAEKENART